jgi:hypothetical protein
MWKSVLPEADQVQLPPPDLVQLTTLVWISVMASPESVRKKFLTLISKSKVSPLRVMLVGSVNKQTLFWTPEGLQSQETAETGIEEHISKNIKKAKGASQFNNFFVLTIKPQPF